MPTPAAIQSADRLALLECAAELRETREKLAQFRQAFHAAKRQADDNRAQLDSALNQLRIARAELAAEARAHQLTYDLLQSLQQTAA